MRILSLQSWVAYGHVGNAAALFPLQRLGAEVVAVNTTQLSNHKDYPDAPGAATEPATIAAITTGLEHRGVLKSLDGVLTGYLGEAAIARAVLDTATRAKAASPDSLYCCDPVLGDGNRLYVARDMPEFFRRRALPLADITTPNVFELGLLTGLPLADRAEAKRALAALQSLGPSEVLLTGYRGSETPADALDLLLRDAYDDTYVLRTPRLPVAFAGTGDVLSALYLFHRLAQRDARIALEAAVSSLFGLIRRTAESGERELLLITAQEEFVHPSSQFRAAPC